MSVMPIRDNRGFSLIETVIAMGLLATALLSLAGVFAMGLRHLASSSANLIAREKAREAVESVHTARDTRVITWAQIANVGQGGVFVTGEQSLREAGPDGLVNTADDANQPIEEVLAPGADGRLGTGDDVKTPLTGFTRQIEISNLFEPDGDVRPNLRQLRVTIRYMVGQNTQGERVMTRTYTLTTYISAIS